MKQEILQWSFFLTLPRRFMNVFALEKSQITGNLTFGLKQKETPIWGLLHTTTKYIKVFPLFYIFLQSHTSY